MGIAGLVATMLLLERGEDEAAVRGPGVARAPAQVVGIGEQQPAMFSDPLFRELGIKKARRVVPWDAMYKAGERQLMDEWLAAARGAGVEPFVTFGHSREEPAVLPTVDEFAAAFAAFRDRYPEVKVYSPWNEVNHSSQPSDRNPRRAAEYYDALRERCPGCTVVAADVLDEPDVVRYLAEFKRHVKGSPRLWGLHNYSDTNRFRNRGTRQVLQAVEGEVWLTETGGIARFGRAFPYDEQRQARATEFTFRLYRSSPRITRLYLYNWTGSTPDLRFDAGLINPDGTPRPAYHVLKRMLRG